MEKLETNRKTLDNYRLIFEKLLGVDFINQADEFLKMSSEEQRRNYHPFFDYWKSYNNDVENYRRTGLTQIAYGTNFIINIVLNLLDIENLQNLKRLINSLLNKNTFYSAAFEIQTARLYSDLYDVQINEETPNDRKTSDFTIYDKYNKIKKINVECKSLEDFDIQNHSKCEILIDNIQKYCNENAKSYKILINTKENFYKNDINKVTNSIIDFIKKESFGTYYINEYNIEVKIENLDNSEALKCCQIQINNSEQYVPLELLPNNFFNLTFIGTNSKPNLNFESQIRNEINTARKQFLQEELNILHIQLPFNNNFDYEQYIHNNYSKIKILLERCTKRINAIVISNSIYQTPNMQFFVIPNCKSRKNIDFDFKYPTISAADMSNIPDLQFNDSKIELKNMFFTPFQDWDKHIPGSIILNLSSSTGKTQFKIWKSYDNTLTLDIIIDGRLRFFKYNNNPFILGQKNKIDLTIQGEKVDLYVNDKKIYDTTLLNTFKLIKGAKN